MLSEYINALIRYGIEKELLPECERIYATNLILDLFQEDSYQETDTDFVEKDLEVILNKLLGEAIHRGIIEDSITCCDLFDTKLMNCLIPRPIQIQEEFKKNYLISPEKATEYYYNLNQNSNYIRTYRIKKDLKWKVKSVYGELDITINLSKPEKDPKAIAAARNSQSGSYPKCLLCMENEGYAGRWDHPGRTNHRIIPVTLDDSLWGFQYSPYVYYNEHCIVFNSQHLPMRIDASAFRKLFDFVKQFPHYFLGSNADLPIVGGSILSHDHFQGGHYDFAMAKAPFEKMVVIPEYEDVEAGIVKWPLSVLRIRHKDEKRLIKLGTHILDVWREYTDEEAFIYAETDGEPHNTITPIARKVKDCYELDLVLRNNITTDEHPLGVYHPHAQHHNIKKENIGLIEVMGLAVLPSRLKEEMEILCDYLINENDFKSNEKITKHTQWVEAFRGNYEVFTCDNTMQILKNEIGKTFVRVLEDAGVFKCSEEGRKYFMRFVEKL